MKPLFLVCLLILVSVIACKKPEEDEKPNQPEKIKGVIQKGPFSRGSQVYLFGLDEDLEPTGIAYSGITLDNLGSYKNDGLLNAPFVLVQSTGYFFNEISGILSDYSFNLKSLTESSDTVNNLNIATTIITDRIIHLVQNEGIVFNSAKNQAQNEVLQIFNIAEDNTINFNHLDLIKNSEQNGVLLAISVAIMGSLQMNEINQLMIDFIDDFKTDGQVNAGIIEKLRINETDLNLKSIKSNLNQGFESISVPPFEKYAKRLVDLEIVDSYPLDSSRSIPSTIDSIKISFNKPLDQQTITSSSIVVTNSVGNVHGSLEYDSENYSVYFRPSSELLKGENYEITITTDLAGLDNIKLGESQILCFKTIGVDLKWGLKAYFPFNNSSSDASGNSWIINMVNTNYTTDISGNTNSACRINGAGSYIEMPNVINITRLNWSYSIWIKLFTLDQGTIPMLLATKYSGGAFSESPLYLRSSNGHLASYTAGILETNESISVGSWYHIVAVIENSVMTMYINGHTAATGFNYFAHWDDEGTSDPDFNGTDTGLFNYYSGKYYISEKSRLDLPTYIDGIVDNIRFYDRPISSEEVLELFSTRK